jgi:hypothetical protein
MELAGKGQDTCFVVEIVAYLTARGLLMVVGSANLMPFTGQKVRENFNKFKVFIISALKAQNNIAQRRVSEANGTLGNAAPNGSAR